MKKIISLAIIAASFNVNARHCSDNNEYQLIHKYGAKKIEFLRNDCNRVKSFFIHEEMGLATVEIDDGDFNIVVAAVRDKDFPAFVVRKDGFELSYKLENGVVYDENLNVIEDQFTVNLLTHAFEYSQGIESLLLTASKNAKEINNG